MGRQLTSWALAARLPASPVPIDATTTLTTGATVSGGRAGRLWYFRENLNLPSVHKEQ
jgi:hypothetical protein